ncbi:translocation/assembly module TamB domain-containing protein [soil metagenome]
MATSELPGRILRRIAKIIGWIALSLLVLLIALIIAIRIPAVQNKIVQAAVSFLQDKIGTPVRLKSIILSFPKKIVISDLYVEDQSGDTLLFASTIGVDIDMWELTNNTIEVNKLELVGSVASLSRPKESSAYNFNYIIDAFASAPDSKPDTTSSAPWKISVHAVELEKISFLYNDRFAGDSINLKLGELAIDMEQFDLDSLVFEAGSVSLKDAKIGFQQSPVFTTATTKNEPSASPLPSISFREIHFEQVDLYYDQTTSHQSLQLLLGELLVEANKIDLNHQLLDLKNVEIKETSLVIQEASLKMDSVLGKNDSASNLSNGLGIDWNIHLSKLKLANNTFQYDNAHAPIKPKAVDFNHLLISFLNISASDISVRNNLASLDLVSTSFHEKSGFSVEQLSTQLGISTTKFDMKDFILKTGYSNMAMQGSASFESLDELVSRYERANLKFDIKRTLISLKDVRYFIPEIIDSLAIYLPSSTNIGMDVSAIGSVGDLTIQKFIVNTFDSTSLAFHGRLKGLPDVKKTVVDVTIDRFYTTGYDAKLILPDTLLPDSIRLPKWVELKGIWKGTMLAPQVNIALTTEVGAIDVKGKFDFNNTPIYDASIKTRELNIGRILRDEETMGNLDLQADIKGSGDKMDNLDVQLDLTVNRFQFNRYDYKNLTMKGFVKKYLFSGKAAIKDENLDLSLNGNLNYNDSIPLYKMTMVLANADFNALHLSETPLKARGTIDVNLNTKDFKVINGKMDIRKVAIFNGKSLYMVDSLLFASIDQRGISKFSINSDILTGDFRGTFNIFSLPSVMKRHINQYFSFQDEKIKDFIEPQKFEFDLTIKNTDLLTEIIFPELDSFTPGRISGAFNSETDSLRMDISLSTIKYSATGMDSLAFRVRSDKKAFNYSIKVKNLTVDTVHVDGIEFVGRIQHDSIYSTFQILDSVAKPKYVLGGVIRSQEDRFRFHFIPDLVMLNYKAWTVPTDNYLQFGKGPLLANDFSISKENEKISVITDQREATISLEFQNLQLSNLTRIIAGKVPASGVLSGSFKVTTKQQGNSNSRLEISNFSLFSKHVGDITFSMTHATDRYNIEMLIKGDSTNVKATGQIISKVPDSELNIDVVLEPLSFQTIEPFTFGHLLDSKGSVMGNIKITGTAKEPSIRGSMTFKDASFKLKDANSSFTLENEKISFEESGIAFNDFTIKDERSNEANIKGSILTKDYRDFELDLRINTKDFQLLNTQPDNNSLFYGLVRINTRTMITGNIDQPKIVMTFSPSEDTNFTYVVPQSAKTALEQQGIIKWVDKDAINDPFLVGLNLEDTITVDNPFKGLDLQATIELNEKAILNIVIDPLTGDKLSVQGSSTLLLGIDPSGEMSLSGRYEIAKGSYDFSFYKLVKREFKIEQGGSITWTGDIMRAQMDITAKYSVEASPLELISNQVSAEQATSYKQQLPFLVYLNIRGQLLSPDISFQLDMPDNKKGANGGIVYARIQDINTRESDLNKQVFALLILKRFIADNPLESQSGSVSNTTRQSVSGILSDQLNRLAENIKGIQLTLDVKSFEDYAATAAAGTTQGQTKVQLGVRKNLLNDRLVVKLSGNVDIEGQNTNTTNSATDYIGDLALEYKLTEDGRLRITGFRNSNYDMISGELTETGAGLIYVKDYNTLIELFKPNAKPKN